MTDLAFVPAETPLALTSLFASSAQGFADLAATGASSVVFVREARGLVAPFYDGVEASAFGAGFVVSQTTLSDSVGFDSLASLVKAIASSLRSDSGAERGLLALLDAFAKENGRKAIDAFEEGAEREGLGGDVAALARAYLGSKRGDRAEARRIRAFLEGREDDSYEISSALTDRNAKRVLASITRLVRVLGRQGTAVVVRRGADVADLSTARREAAYTVIRELADNADGPRGAVSFRVYVSGADELFDGSRALSENTPLALRVAHGELHDAASSLLPHATMIDLANVPACAVADPEEVGKRRVRPLSTIVRLSLGLPPLGEHDLTVGYERVDDAVDKLFEHASNQGSVFSLLAGDYGTGKTHLLMHLTTRALSEKRPVLRLAVERMDADLGNPQRHLKRLLESAILPGRHAPSPDDRFEAWTRTAGSTRKLVKELEAIAETDTQAASAAKKALRAVNDEEPEDMRAVRACLLGHDLEEKPGNPGYRLDAYARLLLWIELFERLDGCAGPVVIIDEAENLYRTGTSKPERRTALRSLGFYCGGSLPNACVILAVTPETLELLREEADAMLDDITEQRTVLACEDVTMLRHRLLRARPMRVAALGKAELLDLTHRLRAVHASARGTTRDKGWDAWAEKAAAAAKSPRELVRAAISRLEATFWLRLD